jgi:hypothetical protein
MPYFLRSLSDKNFIAEGNMSLVYGSDIDVTGRAHFVDRNVRTHLTVNQTDIRSGNNFLNLFFLKLFTEAQMRISFLKTIFLRRTYIFSFETI